MVVRTSYPLIIYLAKLSGNAGSRLQRMKNGRANRGIALPIVLLVWEYSIRLVFTVVPCTYKKGMTEYMLGWVTTDGKSSKPKDAGILEATFDLGSSSHIDLSLEWY
ncbi:hypothetical protein M513_11452 [Trichuris suis]|uniref:Uncharacterized protein n=1 Tax=Trichuris suis TaxID=68888 RepID=A0A085LRR5_9BILA|nr:hypothetical protein M513_11452 [Trichuris suis]